MLILINYLWNKTCSVPQTININHTREHTYVKLIQFHFDYDFFIADKPGRMNTKFSSFTLHHRLFLKSSVHNVQHINNNKWQCIVELFEEDWLMTEGIILEAGTTDTAQNWGRSIMC